MSLSELTSEKIQALATAIINKINDSISEHNSDAEAHSQGSSNANKNVVTDSSGNITTEAKPTIPTGSSTATDIKMNGTQNAGSSSNFAKADHVHPTDTSRASSVHTHGDISNDGKIGTTANKPIITGSGGVLTTGSFGTSANTFCEGNDSRLSDARTPTSHTHGSITNDGKIGTASGKIITTGTGGALQASSSITTSMISDFPSTITPSTHEQATSTITNTIAYDNILAGESTSLTLTDQEKINEAINNKIGALQGIDIINVVSDKGTASASTMNKLYIEVGNDTTDIYYTSKSGNNYSWNKLEDDILEDVNISWNDIQNKPSTFTPSSHTHGDITNDGKIGSTANKPIITTTGGALTTGNFGSSANTFCEGNDSRLSDARTPTSHTHGNITNDGKIGTTSGLPIITTTGGELTTGIFGTNSGQFAEGNHTHSTYTTSSDVQTEIQNFADALAAAINPSS